MPIHTDTYIHTYHTNIQSATHTHSHTYILYRNSQNNGARDKMEFH